MMHDESKAGGHDAPPGVQVNAGDRLYFPAGGLRFWCNEDGTLGSRVAVAVDPWLPDLSAARRTPLGAVDSILADGFSVSTICNQGTIYACQKSQEVRALISDPQIQRLKHMTVVDGKRAVGVLDLDIARGKSRHGESGAPLLVDDVYEQADNSNFMRGNAPLMDYLLTVDRHPFRLIELDGGAFATLDVEDLQKVPVRGVLLMWFSYLESLLAGHLCQERPELQEIVRTRGAVETDCLGSMGGGPERRIERYTFLRLLKESKKAKINSLPDDEIEFLNHYRNNIFHGPRWYITRRSEVSSLVNCVRKVVSLTHVLAAP